MRGRESRLGLLGLSILLCGLFVGCASLINLDGSMKAMNRKIESLEKRLAVMESRQTKRGIALSKARDAVVFVWGAYTFVDSGGHPLRQVLNESGRPIADPQGVPLVDIKGTGPVVYTNYCGTAFLAGPDGLLLSNRHVAQPWWEEKKDEALIRAGLKPAFLILRAFFQEKGEGVPVEAVSYDEKYDIATLRTVNWKPETRPLTMFPESETIREAQAILLVGFPTGLDAVLAKLDESDHAQDDDEPCSYATAEELSKRGLLNPTTTSGFLWEAYPHVLVYDARTVGGGSGGPLLDMSGRVLGVNAAYLEAFQGGNFGIPIAIGQSLFEGRGVPVIESKGESLKLQRLACADDRFSSEAGGICSSRQRERSK